MSRDGEKHPYISDYPSIQVAMRRSKETAKLDGVVNVAIYDDLGNQFMVVKEAGRLLRQAAPAWRKKGNGDMLEYFAQNPDKLREKQERDKKKGKKAAQEQTPNAVDGAAARFRDHLDLKINEHYRMAHPADIPPTLNLIHGNDFIRVVKADGGLHREAVAFIARSTGNVYLAATWDRPRPVVIANVLESDTWRTMRMAFDKSNVPELLGQLKKVLLDKGLDEAWSDLQKCKAPQKVNDAWMSLSKKERKQKSASSGEEFINPKTKAYAKQILGKLKGLKTSWSPKVNLPSNVGGFIMAVFRVKGNNRAVSELNRLFGNNLAVGTGLGLDNDLNSLARNYQRLNDGEIVAIGMLLLRSARQRSAAESFGMWAQKSLNLDSLDTSADTAAPMSPSKVFDADVGDAMSPAAGLLAQVGQPLVLSFCYRLADNINWHAITRTGLFGDGLASGSGDVSPES